MPVGRLVPAIATVRIIDRDTYKPSPEIDSPTIAVTAGNNNAATIFLSPNTGANATVNRAISIPLTAGQTFTFNGMKLGTGGDRNILMGTGLYYVSSSATPNTAVFTYLKQST